MTQPAPPAEATTAPTAPASPDAGTRQRWWDRSLVVGAILLVIGVPVAVLTSVLQTDVGRDDPHFSATYTLANSGDDVATVLPRRTSVTDVPSAVLAGGCHSSRPWAHQQGGMDVGTSEVSIEAVGAKDRTVVIRNIRAERVGSPRPAETGTVLGCAHQGEAEPVAIGLDLDSPNPVALTGYAQGGVGYTPYFRDRYHYLENQKPEVFTVTAMAAEHSYDYVIKVDGSVDGKDTTWTLTDGDKPFRISGVPKEPSNVLSWVGGPSTHYSAGGMVSPRRCSTTCMGEDGKPVAQPAGSLPVQKAPPAPTRPAAKTPPLTVNPRDPESVAIAWAVTFYSSDYTDADGTAQLARTAPYLTPQLYNAKVREWQTPPDNPVPDGPPPEVLHKAWEQVVSAMTFPSSRRPADAQEDRETSLTAPRVRLYLDIQYEILGEDGYRMGPADKPLSDTFELTLARQADGSYLLDTYDRS